MGLRLSNKSIVIVGGTSGLGLSAATACVAEGARLVVIGRDGEKCRQAVAALGEGVQAVVGDAADPSTAQNAVTCAVREYGRLDGLYHVAGGSGRKAGDGPLHEIGVEGWDYTLSTNLSGVFYSNQAAVRQMLKQEEGGSIVNMSSVLGFSPSANFFATHAYAASKAAAIGLSKACAAYYGPDRIRFNVIAPGLVDTPMAQRALADEDTMRYIQTKQCLDGGRAGVATDVDQATVYLLSDESKFVTGQVLAVDGGWSVRG